MTVMFVDTRKSFDNIYNYMKGFSIYVAEKQTFDFKRWQVTFLIENLQIHRKVSKSFLTCVNNLNCGMQNDSCGFSNLKLQTNLVTFDRDSIMLVEIGSGIVFFETLTLRL